VWFFFSRERESAGGAARARAAGVAPAALLAALALSRFLPLYSPTRAFFSLANYTFFTNPYARSLTIMCKRECIFPPLFFLFGVETRARWRALWRSRSSPTNQPPPRSFALQQAARACVCSLHSLFFFSQRESLSALPSRAVARRWPPPPSLARKALSLPVAESSGVWETFFWSLSLLSPFSFSLRARPHSAPPLLWRPVLAA
jgi:hypothetical protein